MRLPLSSKVLLPVAGVCAVVLASIIAEGWLHDPKLAKSDYVGTIDVSSDDARLYRNVQFEWRVASRAGVFKGTDQARVRIDTSGESALLCGWLRTDKAGASVRATRWLSEARLKVGDIKVSAQFVAPVEGTPGDPLRAGCARLDGAVRPATDAPLSFEGPPVPE